MEEHCLSMGGSNFVGSLIILLISSWLYVGDFAVVSGIFFLISIFSFLLRWSSIVTKGIPRDARKNMDKIGTGIQKEYHICLSQEFTKRKEISIRFIHIFFYPVFTRTSLLFTSRSNSLQKSLYSHTSPLILSNLIPFIPKFFKQHTSTSKVASSISQLIV